MSVTRIMKDVVWCVRLYTRVGRKMSGLLENIRTFHAPVFPRAATYTHCTCMQSKFYRL